ncbi:MAG: diguanylate cyclase, partial [Candidatus Adiutrix sp.]|nr:diguanylate cyclase [Candidatus Adiutrix sp.]
MRVGVGYSDNPDTIRAGKQAAAGALKEADRSRPCDLALLFSTIRHDPKALISAAASVLGPKAKIIGGGAVGAITNDRFGYAGCQVVLAAIWLEDVQCEVLTQDGLDRDEEEAGLELGRKLAALSLNDTSPVMLFYDAVNRSQGDLRLIMATPFLKGLERGLGFMPALVGAGLMADYACSPYWQ